MFSWLITATGALLLALVFAGLAAKIPKMGGPHTFIEAAFGKSMGFFSAWTYWVISWLSTPMVVISVVGYLSPLLGNTDPIVNLVLEISILLFIMGLNLSGVRTAGRVEFVFTLLKLLPLLIVPMAGLFFIETTHFVPFNPTKNSTLGVINAAALLTLWGFIGVESATTPSESIVNPRKTIPRAIITGTFAVAIVYIFASFVILGVVSPEMLAHSKAPFADAAQIIFGGNWYLLISVAASIVCLGTLNAWILTSGQIALGAAYDGHLPKLFSVKNKQGVPKWSLIISSLGMVPILIITMNQELITQVNNIIDISVTAFLFIYAWSVLSYLKLFYFVFGQWDTGPHNIIVQKIQEKIILYAIDNAGIKNRQYVKYGSLPFVRVCYSDNLQTNDWHLPFPFENEKVIENPTLQNLLTVFGDKFPEALLKKFSKKKIPMHYVLYKNSLWIQFHASESDFILSYTNHYPKNSIEKLKRLDMKILNHIFSEAKEADFLKKDYLNAILERRDQVIRHYEQQNS